MRSSSSLSSLNHANERCNSAREALAGRCYSVDGRIKRPLHANLVAARHETNSNPYTNREIAAIYDLYMEKWILFQEMTQEEDACLTAGAGSRAQRRAAGSLRSTAGTTVTTSSAPVSVRRKTNSLARKKEEEAFQQQSERRRGVGLREIFRRLVGQPRVTVPIEHALDRQIANCCIQESASAS